MKNIDRSDLHVLSDFFKALGNPVRLSIVQTLIERSHCKHVPYSCICGENCEEKKCKCGCKCGELVDLFPISQSTISQHIKELKNVGLIDTRGRKGEYVLNYEKLNEGINSLIDLARFKFTMD